MNKRCIHLILSYVYFVLKINDLIFINYKYSASYTFQMFPQNVSNLAKIEYVEYGEF